MGKNYACTYMGAWEETLLRDATFKPSVYFRFIDDIFGVWLHGEEELNEFHRRANNVHSKTEVDLRVSRSEIEFLDVMVKLGTDGYIETDLFEKPTDSKSYLHFSSDHPSHMKKAIPYGLGLRMKRICTREDDYKKHRGNLKGRLLERGYPDSLVERELRKVDKVKRDTILTSRKNRDVQQRVPLALTYSRYLPNITAILKSKRHLLHRSERMASIFPSDPMVAYKRGKNLEDILVHGKTRRVLSDGRIAKSKTVVKVVSFVSGHMRVGS